MLLLIRQASDQAPARDDATSAEAREEAPGTVLYYNMT